MKKTSNHSRIDRQSVLPAMLLPVAVRDGCGGGGSKGRECGPCLAGSGGAGGEGPMSDADRAQAISAHGETGEIVEK